MQLRVAQRIPDTEAEGPGRRYALWVQGCTLRCPGCCNPEMFAPDRGGAVHDVEALAAEVLATPHIEGLSVLGGEPLQQAEAVAELCARVQAGGRSVMVYTGYTRAELDELRSPAVAKLLSATDLLVDGRYDETKPERQRRWLGSSNQVLHFLTARYLLTDPRFWSANTIELRYERGTLTVNGWPAHADSLRK